MHSFGVCCTAYWAFDGSFFPFDSFSRTRISFPNYVEHGSQIPAKITVNGKAILQYVRMRLLRCQQIFLLQWRRLHWTTMNSFFASTQWTCGITIDGKWRNALRSLLNYENRHQNKERIMVIIGMKLARTVCLYYAWMSKKPEQNDERRDNLNCIMSSEGMLATTTQCWFISGDYSEYE